MIVGLRGKFELQSRASRLGHVIDETRRACARREVQLEILDVHIERRDVDGGAAAREPRLHARLVIPHRLVLPATVPAERERICGRADRFVERVVDTAEPEAARELGIEHQGVGGLVVRDEPWREAVGLGRAGVGDVADKETVEELCAVFFEVIPARARREIELRRDTQRRFAEHRGLPQVVMQVREEQVVFRRQGPLREAVRLRRWREAGLQNGTTDGSRKRVETPRIHVLPVAALGVRIEASYQPVQALPRAGDPDLLRPHERIRVILERVRKRVDVLRQSKGPSDDAGIEGTSVPLHQDIAMRVRRDRGQHRPAEIELQIDVTEQELVRVRLCDGGEELSRPQRHFRPGRRVRIREDVERVVAIPPVGLDVLIDDARRNVKPAAGLQPQSGS